MNYIVLSKFQWIFNQLKFIIFLGFFTFFLWTETFIWVKLKADFDELRHSFSYGAFYKKASKRTKKKTFLTIWCGHISSRMSKNRFFLSFNVINMHCGKMVRFINLCASLGEWVNSRTNYWIQSENGAIGIMDTFNPNGHEKKATG